MERFESESATVINREENVGGERAVLHLAALKIFASSAFLAGKKEAE